MLILPDDWRSLPGGAAILGLLAQIPDKMLKREFVRNLIPASLELSQAALRRTGRSSHSVQTMDRYTWRVAEVCYKYLPVVDDDAIRDCERIANETSSLFLIVSPTREFLLKCAIRQILGAKSPIISSVIDFISLRTSFASVDARWTTGRTLLELLSRFNCRTREAGAPDAIMIDLPRDPVVGLSTKQMQVPTYDPDSEVEYDYRRPSTLTLQEADGLRVVLGEPDDEDAGDVQIERAIDRWRVFVRPDNGDTFCIIEIGQDRATVESGTGEVLLDQRLR